MVLNSDNKSHKTIYTMIKKYKQCGIYCYHNIVNGKNYIGQSTNLDRRKKDFKRNRTYSGKIFQNAIKKYGKDKFQYSILTHCKPEELNYYEQFYISRLKTNDRKYGYNCTSGGDSRYEISEETKEQIRNSWDGERRKKQSQLQSGEKNNFFGCKHSIETRKRLSAFRIENGKKRFMDIHGYTIEELEKKIKKYVHKNPYATYKDIMVEFNVSLKTVYKLCKKIGYTSDLAIQKLRENEKKVVVQCDRKNHNLVLNYFISISNAKEVTGIRSINNCLNGSSSHAGGYFWRLLNENEVPNYEVNEKYLKPTEDANKLDDDTKRRIKESGAWNHENRQKKVFCYGSNGCLVKKYDAVKYTENDGFRSCDVSNCCKGKTRTYYGFVFSYKELTSEEVKEKFVKNNIKPIVQMTIDGVFVKNWDSATEAANALGLSTMSNINGCCHGRVKTAGGYKWMFKEDYC